MKKIKIGACICAILMGLGFATACSSKGSSNAKNSANEPTKTWATNFKGIITETEADGFVYKNYYINKNDWLIGDNVAFPKYNSEVEKDYMRFFDSTNRSLFGPRVRYEDFVCRFTVIIDNVDLAGSGASLGLSFNRKTLYSYANDCPGILFMKSDEGTAVRATQGDIDKAEGGTIWLQYKEDNAVDLWSKKNGKYDFMVVKSGDTAQLYYAEAGDTESLKVLRATVSGVSGEGFVAMSGIMGVNFHLDNFGVWDLNEASDALDTYIASGSVGFSGKKATVGHGASLLSANAYSDVSVTYDLQLTSGNSFACTVGDKVINFASNGDITCEGLTAEKKETVDFSAFAQGGAVRLRKIGVRIYVDVNDGTGYTTKAVFNGISGEVQFGIKASEDATLIIDTPAIVSLDGTVEIETKDYDPNVDVDPMTSKDVSFNEYYGG